MKAFLTLHRDPWDGVNETHIDVMSIVSVSEDSDQSTRVDVSSGHTYIVAESVEYIFEKMESAFAHLDS
ncbi:hypothetical protein SEA_RAHALELUJAH_38 [Mycobacterium phage Rahalelujah]|nr:hypothetical protein SEA_RAHALELUJAH_38 [Mycobacterium phage Rahalelujah]